MIKQLVKRRSFHRYIKTSYAEDTKLFYTIWRKFWLVLLLAGLIVFPMISDVQFIYIANLVGIFIIGAIGLNLLTGLTGQISLGHAAFMAIGAYATAIITAYINLPFFIIIPLVGIISGVIGTIIALPALRLKGLYLAMVTFAFFFIVEYIAYNWKSVTGGSAGITVGAPTVGKFSISGEKQFYILIMVIAVVLVYFAVNITRTKIGRALGAIRDRDIAAGVMGINLTRYKVQAYFLSSFYAGVAGSLYGMYFGYISPEHFSFMLSIQFLAMILVGGMGSVAGSIFGAIFLTIIPELLRYLVGGFRESFPQLVQQFGDVQTIFYGLIIIVTLMFAPKGLFGLWLDFKTYVKRWPFSY